MMVFKALPVIADDDFCELPYEKRLRSTPPENIPNKIPVDSANLI
jgi:hypothetical protein